VREDNNYEIITPERCMRVALIITTLRKERGMWGKKLFFTGDRDRQAR